MTKVAFFQTIIAIFAVSLVLTAGFVLTGSASPNRLPNLGPKFWTAVQAGTGAVAVASDDVLTITLYPDGADNPSTGVFGAGLTSKCSLTGNFDIQVHFRLVDWPFANGVRVGLGGHPGFFLSSNFGLSTPNTVERVSFGLPSDGFPGQPPEVYLTDFVDRAIAQTVPTSDLTGSLRLVRSGTLESGYFSGPNGWVLIHSGPGLTTDFPVSIMAWSHNYAFKHELVKVAMSGFVLNAGTLICP